MTNRNKAYMAILAIIVVLTMTMQNSILEDKIDMLVELAEQDMIEYCIDIQPTEYDMEMINDNN